MAQPILPNGVNAVGIVAMVVFFFCWIGAALSFFTLRKNSINSDDPLAVWKEPEARKRFLRFFLFCLAGLLCGGVAFAFGGWPVNYE
ncbi:MAG: hypothetical protein R3C31_12685 [Hyphomonadaceae bacterium]